LLKVVVDLAQVSAAVEVGVKIEMVLGVVNAVVADESRLAA
jgi:hypothetical protein